MNLDRPCVEASGHRTRKGYVLKRVGGRRRVGAHRLAFFKAHGWWPAVVMHLCDNPPCIEPSHLQAGTNAENVRDSVAKGRAACLRTGETALAAKLTNADVVHIRSEAAAGASQRDLAKKFGVSQSTVWRAIHGHTKFTKFTTDTKEST